MYGPKWQFVLILIVYEPGVVVVNCWDRFCILGRDPRTKETLPNFHEWCRVTREMRRHSVEELVGEKPYQVEKTNYMNEQRSYQFKPNPNLPTHYTPALRNHESFPY